MCSLKCSRSERPPAHTYSRAHGKQSVVTFSLQETHARDPPAGPTAIKWFIGFITFYQDVDWAQKPYWLSWWKQEIAEMEIKSFVVPGVRIPGGTVCNCRLLSGITPSNLLPSILSPMETWKRRHLRLLCCEMTLALSPPPATAILPLWSLTEDAALSVCTISSTKFDSNQPSAFISFMWKWSHMGVMLIIISA